MEVTSASRFDLRRGGRRRGRDLSHGLPAFRRRLRRIRGRSTWPKLRGACAKRRRSWRTARCRSPRFPMSTRRASTSRAPIRIGRSTPSRSRSRRRTSRSWKRADDPSDVGIEDKVLPVEEGASLRKMLMDEGADPDSAAAIQSALVANFSFDFRAGQKVRLGLAPDPDTGAVRPVRVSLYEPNDRHIATVALSDNGVYVAAHEPAAKRSAGSGGAGAAGRRRARCRRCMTGCGAPASRSACRTSVIKSLVHIFSYDVDYQSRLSPNDDLDVIYSADEARATTPGDPLRGADARRRHAQILPLPRFDRRLGRLLRRGRQERAEIPGEEAGRDRALLLAASACAAIPILHRYRMHTGVDWAAPTGTPIMAAGDGTIEKIGTRAGYGRSITLKHLHGYETTYNHMSGYAKGLKVGDNVKQNQIDRLHRLDRPFHRPASSLRGAGQRPLRRPAEDPRAARARVAGRASSSPSSRSASASTTSSSRTKAAPSPARTSGGKPSLPPPSSSRARPGIHSGTVQRRRRYGMDCRDRSPAMTTEMVCSGPPAPPRAAGVNAPCRSAKSWRGNRSGPISVGRGSSRFRSME